MKNFFSSGELKSYTENYQLYGEEILQEEQQPISRCISTDELVAQFADLLDF